MLNIIALLIACVCIYWGLPQYQTKIQRIGLKSLVMLGFFAAFCMLWCVLFYGLMDFPIASARPWSLWSFIKNTQSFSLLVNLKLWALPTGLCILVAASKIAPLLEPSWKNLYGDAHFATLQEVKAMELLEDNPKNSVIVGNYNGRLLQYELTNHLLVFAPSRSGKGVALVIPNALNWQGSMLVTDNKYEVFKYTSGYRQQQGNAVYRFSPAHDGMQTHRINPLDYISRDPNRKIADLHLILDLLILNAEGDNQMWAEEARSIALGILLWLMQSDRPFTLGEFAAIIKAEGLDLFLKKVMMECTLADNLITIEPAAFLAIQNFLQKAPKEQSGVRSTLTAMVRLWEDPLICAATHCSDVDFRDMRKRPITLYLSFGTDQIDRLAPLINLIIQLFLNVMLKNLPTEAEPHKVLCLLDEINRFGRMDKLRDGFGDLAGYGVHLMPIIQNVGQFYTTYKGRDGTDIFFQNTDLKISFRHNTDTDRQLVSNELGKKTVRIKNRSYQTGREGASYSESLIERPLLTPQQIGQFPKTEQLVMTGDGIVRCKKIIYYKDKRFQHKILAPIIVPTVKPAFPVMNIIQRLPDEALSGVIPSEKPQKPPKKEKKPKKKELVSELSHEFETEED